MSFSAAHFQMLAASAEGDVPGVSRDTQCPLCLVLLGSSWKTFTTHVGKHLEDIALTVVPLDLAGFSEKDEMCNDNQQEANGAASEVPPSRREGQMSLSTEVFDSEVGREVAPSLRVDSLQPLSRTTAEQSEEWFSPRAQIFCSVFVLQTQQPSRNYKKMANTTTMPSVPMMFRCMERQSQFLNVHKVLIIFRCDGMEQGYLLERDDIQQLNLINRTIGGNVEYLSRSYTNKRYIELFVEPAGTYGISLDYIAEENHEQPEPPSISELGQVNGGALGNPHSPTSSSVGDSGVAMCDGSDELQKSRLDKVLR